MQCSFTKCSEGAIITPSHDHVEVRAFHLSQKGHKNLQVSWNIEGEATFHSTCWHDMCKAAKDESSEIVLSHLERKMILEAEKTAEFHDSMEKLKEETKRIAMMIKTARYCIAFTGAGISTAAGIGDFRGKDGKWTNMDKKKEYGAKGVKKSKPPISSYRPTYTHEALQKMVEMGFIKHVISQNCDGLHRLSGIPPERLSELHGNCYIEKCEKCGTRYERKFSHRTVPVGHKALVPPQPCHKCHINHRTGGICEKQDCEGYLMNTIINFGDFLEDSVLSDAKAEASKADLVFCLGSTLQVTPANMLIEMGQKPTRLIICNRQVTPYDFVCCQKEEGATDPNGCRVFGDCDDLMREVMLNILGPEGVLEWEELRPERMKLYDQMRVDEVDYMQML
ncbi:hypothetical protein ACJMK2_035029 [Sinanodonta woodiana]|uniref:Deacetylase sirtuin-type domain-containing protein n=1 Tax=Sinanodonta woodiana TaxID=1069815 RepID=A0ABD3WTI3_SINWO